MMVNFDYNIIKRNQDSVARSWAGSFWGSVFIGVGAFVGFLATFKTRCDQLFLSAYHIESFFVFVI